MSDVEIPYATVPKTHMSIWPWYLAPEALREGLAESSVLVYIPAQLLSMYPPWPAIFERDVTELRVEEDGSLTLSTDLATKAW